MEPLKRLQSPISTASDTAVRTLTPRRQARRLAVGAELAVVVETGDGLIKPVAARGGVHHRIVGVIEGRQRTGPHADHMVAADTLQPGVVDPGPRPGAVIDDPAAQQHLGQAVAGGHQVAAGIGARAHQVTGPLPGTGRDPHRDDIVVARQAGQQDRVPAIGLDPLAARAQQLGGRRHLAGDPLLGQGPASSKPVGPASQRHLDVPVPRPQAGDQRHDLAGITGHRPLNQPASVSVSIAAALMERARASSPRLLRSVNTGASYACRHPDPLTVGMIHEVAYARPRPASHQTPPHIV